MRIFEIRENGSLEPSDYASGPFGGLQGGAIAAMLCTQLEATVAQHDLGIPVSVSTTFLRPSPVAPFQTSPAVLRQGARSSTLMNELAIAGNVSAVTVLSTLKPMPLGGIPDVGRRSFAPLSCERREARRSPTGNPWLMDLFDVREDTTNQIVWFGVDAETAHSMSPLALALLVADWTHGIARPVPSGFADPNINLNVHCLRPPGGRWIGVSSRTDWTASGIGMAQGALYDIDGHFGGVSMSVALSKLPAIARTESDTQER